MYQLEGLVFICRENRRRSGILLFLESPRLCLLSGMAENKSGKSGRVPEFLRGGRRETMVLMYQVVYVGVNNRIITMIHLPSITYIFRYHVRRWNF